MQREPLSRKAGEGKKEKRRPFRDAYCISAEWKTYSIQGISETWITSGAPMPPTDLMAHSASFRP